MGAMSRCHFLRHFKRMNRCVHLRLGVLLHGGHYGTSLQSMTVLMVVFSVVLDFDDACSRVGDFIRMCSFLKFNVIVLVRLVKFRKGCVSKLVAHGRSVGDLLATGCCVCDLTRVVPLVLLVPTFIVKGTDLLNTITLVFLAANPICYVLFRLTMCGRGAMPLGRDVANGRDVGAKVRVLVDFKLFVMPAALCNALPVLLKRA